MQNNPQITTAQLGASMLATSKQIIQYATANLKGRLKFEPEPEYEKVYLHYLTADKIIIEVKLCYSSLSIEHSMYSLIVGFGETLPKVEMSIEFVYGDELFLLMPEKIISSLHLSANLNKEIIIEI